MGSLADNIERHIRSLLEEAERGVVEIQRRDLASLFGCAPSQINYVLETRFTPARGFLIESRRGGGGFIRIVRLSWEADEPLLERLPNEIGDSIGESEAEDILFRLAQSRHLSNRRASMIKALLRSETSRINPPFRDVIRAILLRAVLMVVLEGEEV